jgi:hypothetical protein
MMIGMIRVMIIYEDEYGNNVGREIMNYDEVKTLLWKGVPDNIKSAQIFTSEDEFASGKRVSRFVEYIPEKYK